MKTILICAFNLIVGITTAFADGTNAASPSAPTAGSAASDSVAVIKTTEGTMVIAFWPKEAPNTVTNFEGLAKQGFYDGTAFHRIIKGLMVQGGDPLTKVPGQEDAWGTGGPGYAIKAEFNDHSLQYGVISMARNPNDPNSGGSQFFICDGNDSSLDHQYTAFGHLIKGGDVLDKIANTPCGPNPNAPPGELSKPLQRVDIINIKIVPANSIH